MLIAYVSMWGSCEKMARALQQDLVKKGINVNIFDVPNSGIGEIAKELVDTPILVVAAPTVLSGVHPVAAYAAMLVKALRAPTRYAAVLTSYGWGGGAIRQLQDILSGTKIEIIGAVEVKGPPKQPEFDKINELAGKIEEKLREFQAP